MKVGGWVLCRKSRWAPGAFFIPKSITGDQVQDVRQAFVFKSRRDAKNVRAALEISATFIARPMPDWMVER